MKHSFLLCQELSSSRTVSKVLCCLTSRSFNARSMRYTTMAWTTIVRLTCQSLITIIVTCLTGSSGLITSMALLMHLGSTSMAISENSVATARAKSFTSLIRSASSGISIHQEGSLRSLKWEDFLIIQTQTVLQLAAKAQMRWNLFLNCRLKMEMAWSQRSI